MQQGLGASAAADRAFAAAPSGPQAVSPVPASIPLRILSLFAGIGGFDLGLERTGGFQTVAVAETDPYASRVLAKRFPDAPNVGDVTTAEYPDADIICAGFPCQDISFAGAGAGLAGARSGLWREVVRAIRVVRPQYAILENVAALLSRGLGTVLGDLAEIGHDAEWHCIPASAVGAPHRRDRVWIVANPGSEQHEGGRAPLSGGIAAELSRSNSDASGERLGEAGKLRCDESAQWLAGLGEEVANADCARLEGRQEAGYAESCGTRSHELAKRRANLLGRDWAVEPDVGRVAHGIPKRVDRLRCLGNAVVPQIPELIGRAILAAQGIPTRKGGDGDNSAPFMGSQVAESDAPKGNRR